MHEKESDIIARRFMKLEVVMEILDISRAQAYSLVRRGELRAIQIGGRRQWRIEDVALAEYLTNLSYDSQLL